MNDAYFMIIASGTACWTTGGESGFFGETDLDKCLKYSNKSVSE